MNIFLDLLAKFESDFKAKNHSKEYSFKKIFKDVTYKKISIKQNHLWLLSYDLGMFSYKQLISLLYLKNIIDYKGTIDITLDANSVENFELPEKELYENSSRFHVEYKFYLPYKIQHNQDEFKMIREICYIEIVSMKSITKDI
ncbi:hypothetical protein [Pleurocapsa sp. PCC 7319]|uniref:hypothetical protein n=1 Tax=Pleurocapsa sp. PCC 7319 TaxID=118161 RepID=UPI00034A2EFB|nr:hypothetical protein [Pleurocapsa sp. PCC 7319]